MQPSRPQTSGNPDGQQEKTCYAQRRSGATEETIPAQHLQEEKGDSLAERAPIPYRDDQNRVADFHALRHSFITALAQSGVHPSVAKSLARHSTITLTMDRYTHTVLESQAEAIAGLPNE